MNRFKVSLGIAFALVIGLSDLEWTSGSPVFNVLGAPAEARVGRPATALSYAGVSRRSSRRVVRRTSVRLNSIPSSCVYGNFYGGSYYNCAGVYYEKSGTVYVQVVFE
jgi:hypothetical protein